MKKHMFLILTIVFISIIAIWIFLKLISGLVIGGFFFKPLGYDDMQKSFEKNYDDIQIVCNYLSNCQYQDIYISNTMKSGIMSYSGENIQIKSSKAIKSINKLKLQGYSIIGKNDNTIYFQRWSNLDNGRGIAYTIDGTEPVLQFLTKTKAFSINNWYYYEENYNEWKMNQISQEKEE